MHDLRVLHVQAFPPHQHGTWWDLTSFPEDHRCHWGVSAAVSLEGGFWGECDLAYVRETAQACNPQLIYLGFPDAWTNAHLPEVPRLHMAIDAAHSLGLPVLSYLEPDQLDFLFSDSALAVEFTKLLDKLDGILVCADGPMALLPHITSTPLYWWERCSEVCRQLAGSPYPDGPRDLIAVVAFHSGWPGRRCGGTIHNYLVLKPLLERHPDLTLWALKGLHGTEDPYIDYLGLRGRCLPAYSYSRGLRPWRDIIAMLHRTKLAVHLEAYDSRSQFLLECAACGVPCVTNACPQAAKYLEIGRQVRTMWDIGAAIEYGSLLLDDHIAWETESRRLFAASKANDITMTDRIFRAVIARGIQPHRGE